MKETVGYMCMIVSTADNISTVKDTVHEKLYIFLTSLQSIPVSIGTKCKKFSKKRESYTPK